MRKHLGPFAFKVTQIKLVGKYCLVRWRLLTQINPQMHSVDSLMLNTDDIKKR